MAKDGGMKGGSMLSGLTVKSPSASDSSTRPPKGAGSVSSDTTRDSVAPNNIPKGERCA